MISNKNQKLTLMFEEQKEGGFIGFVKELSGVNTQGETLDEVKINLSEALTLVLNEGNNTGPKFNRLLQKNNAIKKAKEFIAACADKNIFFNKVIVFGSMVNGTAKEYSDIDVALVSDQFKGMPIADRKILSQVNIKFIDIEPHPYTTKYFEEGDPLIEEIKRTGIEINQ